MIALDGLTVRLAVHLARTLPELFAMPSEHDPFTGSTSSVQGAGRFALPPERDRSSAEPRGLAVRHATLIRFGESVYRMEIWPVGEFDVSYVQQRRAEPSSLRESEAWRGDQKVIEQRRGTALQPGAAEITRESIPPSQDVPLIFEGRQIGFLTLDSLEPSQLPSPGEHPDPDRPTPEVTSSAAVPAPDDPLPDELVIPTYPSGPLLYLDAATWVVIAAFAGMALAWATALAPAWAGLLIGGGIAFFIAVGIASRG
jgi:hypothetical protein